MADTLQPPEEAQPVPEIQPDTFAGIVQRLEAAEAAVAKPNPLNDIVNTLHVRLSAVEQALAALAGGSLQMHLGASEIAAIGNALESQITQHVHDVLKEHFNFTPPPLRGDRPA